MACVNAAPLPAKYLAPTPPEFVIRLVVQELVGEPTHPHQNHQFHLFGSLPWALFLVRLRVEPGKLGFSRGILKGNGPPLQP